MMQETADLSPITLDDIKAMATRAGGSVVEIINHWSAGNYGQMYTDYHLGIDQDGQVYCSTDDLTEVKSHCWHRNTGRIGIAMLCGSGAMANNGYDADLGDQPPTKEQIESLARVNAVICTAAGLPITSIKTHCEAATEDGYGPGSGDPETRWDLWYINDNGELKLGGQLIRDKAAWYQNNK